MRRITSGSISFNDDYPPDIIRINDKYDTSIFHN